MAGLLQRISEVNPGINALVTIGADSALHQAREADQAIAVGALWGPLHGVPFTVKDTFEALGMRTTAGAEELRGYVPTEDSTVVSRLRAAGAILLGKTNTPRLAVDWQTYNSLFGVTNNPHDLSRTPGGSSGGCAAAISAELSYLSVGSDMGGSIRIPASFCGVYGHRPSAGIIPSKGNIPPLPGKPHSGSGLGVRGPLARSPADLKLALQVLGGPADAEQVAWSWTLPPARYARLSDYRIGFMFDDSACQLSADVRAVLDSALDALRDSGVDLAEGWPKGFVPQEQFRAFRVLSVSRKTGQSDRKFLPDGSRRDILAAKSMVLRAREIWREYFRTHDAFLLPVAFVPAFPHDHSEPLEERLLQTTEGPRSYLNLAFWVSFATLAGLPVTTAPVGITDSGLPVGIQIVGPYLEDATPIDLAGGLADVIGGPHSPAPQLQCQSLSDRPGDAGGFTSCLKILES